MTAPGLPSLSCGPPQPSAPFVTQKDVCLLPCHLPKSVIGLLGLGPSQPRVLSGYQAVSPDIMQKLMNYWNFLFCVIYDLIMKRPDPEHLGELATPCNIY